MSRRALYRSQLTLLKPFVDKCPLSVVRKTQDSIGRLVTNSYKSQVKINRLKVGNINCALLTPGEDLSGRICRAALSSISTVADTLAVTLIMPSALAACLRPSAKFPSLP